MNYQFLPAKYYVSQKCVLSHFGSETFQNEPIIGIPDVRVYAEKERSIIYSAIGR